MDCAYWEGSWLDGVSVSACGVCVSCQWCNDCCKEGETMGMWRIAVDWEHNANEWWDAVTGDNIAECPEACRDVVVWKYREEYVVVDEETMNRFVDWGSKLPGWIYGPFVYTKVNE